ncbi:MAG: YjdF family protein [Lawsonibacter sp.]|nr:YjdF family protein [Lawsonibacter sp.]
MEHGRSSFTVTFQSPFWVGLAERWGEEGYQAARVVFGPEPTDPQVYQWLEREWCQLPFTAPAAGESPKPDSVSPKRRQREAPRALSRTSTQSQAALSRQREADGLARQTRRRDEKREAEEQKFRLRQEKKREKKRGH